uniref:Uncharacterized protein n=1 Tax=Brassica oleracea var. oleracea TaxID=109376 RepID=A0A0D3E772_BRAOL
MTNPHVLSGELKAGRRRKTIVTHVLRSWEARNVKKRGDLMDKGLQPHNQHEQVITQSDNKSLLPAFQTTPLASTDNMNTCNTALYTFSFMSRVAESSRCDLTQCIHKLEPDGAGRTSNTQTTRQKSSFMKTCLIHNKSGAQYIVGMEEYLLYKNIDKAQSRT